MYPFNSLRLATLASYITKPQTFFDMGVPVFKQASLLQLADNLPCKLLVET